MSQLIYIKPIHWALVLLVAGFLGSVESARSREAGDGLAGAGTPEGRTAILVYIAWQELEGAVLDPTELRLTTTGFLAESLRAQGHEIISRDALAPLVTRWRLRNSLMLREEFLTALQDELAGDRLLVAQLLLQPGRLLMAWRLVDTASGTLVRVGFCGANLAQARPDRDLRNRSDKTIVAEPQGSGAWLVAARQTARSLVLPVGESIPRGDGSYLVFPVRSVGSDFGGTSLATHSLLVELVEQGGLALPDPGLVLSTLRGSGFTQDQMSAKLRGLLQERFGSRTALIGELISYDIVDSRPGPVGPMVEESISSSVQQVDQFALSLKEIDLETGRVLTSNEVYENRSVETGWFGVQRRHSLLERLQSTVAELWTVTTRQSKDGGNDSPD